MSYIIKLTSTSVSDDKIVRQSHNVYPCDGDIQTAYEQACNLLDLHYKNSVDLVAYSVSVEPAKSPM